MAEQISKYVTMAKKSGNGGAKWCRSKVVSMWQWRSKVAMAELVSSLWQWQSKAALAELIIKYLAMAEQIGNGGAKWQWRSKVATPQQSGKLAVSSKHIA